MSLYRYTGETRRVFPTLQCPFPQTLTAIPNQTYELDVDLTEKANADVARYFELVESLPKSDPTPDPKPKPPAFTAPFAPDKETQP